MSAGALAGIGGARDLGLVEVVRELMTPTADAVVFGVTNLGDSWFLLVALTLFYWYASERDDGLLAVALALGALALVATLKHLFALPRPPAHLQAYPATGYGFPSGHALGSTVVWGAMAWLGARWDRRRGLAVAVPVIVAVGLSRVVLGVHYLGSVLAGFAIGAAFLAGTVWLARTAPARPAPERAYAVAAALGVLAMAAGATGDGASALGGALGGGLAARSLDLDGPVTPVGAVAGLVVFGGLFVGTLAVEPPWPALLLAEAVVVAGLLAVPALDERARAKIG